MTFARLALACVLHIMGGGRPVSECQNDYFYEVSLAIEGASAEFNVPPDIIAAVIYHESKFKKDARGKRGEAGLMQIKRHGAVAGPDLRLTFRQLCDVKTNVTIGTRYLAQVLGKCPGVSRGLSRYNRGHGCSVSNYGRRVQTDRRQGYRDISTLVLTDHLRLLYFSQETNS